MRPSGCRLPAAERAGLREGDVFVRFAGTAVDGLKELRSLFRGRKPGYSVPVVYLHNGEVHSTWVTLGPAHRLAHGPPPRGGVNGRR